MHLRPHIVLAGGGTLGNLYPGIAIAARLAQSCPNADLTFIGSGDASERHVVTAEGVEYLAIPSSPPPRGPLHCLRFVTDNSAGYLASRWMLGERQASLVVGLGGAVSAVASRAAVSRGVPLVLLEQNAAPSRTARMLGHRAEAVCLAFDETHAHLPVATNTIVTGTPVRPEFHALSNSHRESIPLTRERQLVILSGSINEPSRLLNQAIPPALHRVRHLLDGWRVVHQTGEGQLQQIEKQYETCGVEAICVSHVDQMPSLLGPADLAVCRPGGAMLAELAATETPAVLVASSDNADALYAANAHAAELQGGCCAVQAASDRGLQEGLIEHLQQLLRDHDRRRTMAQSMHENAQPDAADQIAGLCMRSLGLEQTRLAA